MVTLRRSVSKEDLQPGEYLQVKDEEIICHYKCPKCGLLTKIARSNHTINIFGLLTPLVTCPHKCTFSEQIQLDEWVPEAKGSA